MTGKTTEESNAEAEAFVKMVKDNMPDSLRGGDIVTICGSLITTYGDSEEALMWAMTLITSLQNYYAEDAEDCDCPKCTERRRNTAH